MFKTLKAPLESLKTQTSIINYVFGFRRLATTRKENGNIWANRYTGSGRPFLQTHAQGNGKILDAD